MRVGIDVRALVGERSGLGWHTYALVSHILSQRADQEIVLLGDDDFPEQELWRSFCEIRLAGRRFHATPLRFVWDDWFYGRMLAGTGCEVGFSPLSVVAARSRIPCVATVHDLAFLKLPRIMPRGYRRYWLRTIQRTVRHAHTIIAVSVATREDLVFYAHADARRIEVVYAGVDPFFREPVSTDEAEQILGRFGLAPGYLLFVGTNEPRKNLPLVLDAYALLDEDLRRQHPLVLVGGEGWLSHRWRAKERALLPFVYRVGYVERSALRVLYRHAACFLFPSLYEGFGMPVLEAMACGVPVVTSGVSALPEIGGTAAEYVDPGSPRALVTAIRRVLDDPVRRQVMIESGYRQVEKFSWALAARQTWQILVRAAQA